VTAYYYQRLRKDVTLALAAEGALEDNVGNLRKTVTRLAHAMTEMSLVVDVLLGELGRLGIDADKVHAAVTEALATRQPQEPVETCTRCGREVPLRLTTITATGTVCDACVP
jgi:hypothetical protein